MPTGRRTI